MTEGEETVGKTENNAKSTTCNNKANTQYSVVAIIEHQ